MSLLVRLVYYIVCADEGGGEKSKRKGWPHPSSVSSTFYVCFQSGEKSGGNPLEIGVICIFILADFSA